MAALLGQALKNLRRCVCRSGARRKGSFCRGAAETWFFLEKRVRHWRAIAFKGKVQARGRVRPLRRVIRIWPSGEIRLECKFGPIGRRAGVVA